LDSGQTHQEKYRKMKVGKKDRLTGLKKMTGLKKKTIKGYNEKTDVTIQRKNQSQDMNIIEINTVKRTSQYLQNRFSNHTTCSTKITVYLGL